MKNKNKSKLAVRFIIFMLLSFFCISNIPCYLIVISILNGFIIYIDRNYTSDMV